MAPSKVKDGNYIVIQSFMIKDLKLKGNELLTYAIIYGFSQNGEDKFTGSLQYIADWTNSTKQGIMKNLKSLVDKGLLEKTEVFKNGVKFVEYHVTDYTTMQQSLTGYETKFNRGIQQSLTPPIQQSLTNNIVNNNIVNNKDIKKESKKDSNGYNAIIQEKFSNNEVIEALKEFIKMRTMIKKPLTDYALKMLCNKLIKLSSDPDTQVKILQQSIMNNWQGIFELKEDQKQQQKQSNFKSIADNLKKQDDTYNDIDFENLNF